LKTPVEGSLGVRLKKARASETAPDMAINP
jgi:hypothetical protein